MIDVVDVAGWLVGPIGLSEARNVDFIGQGAWSSAFGFDHGGGSFVVRIGEHVSDFRRDEAMSQFASRALPIPEVVAIGSIPSDGPVNRYYCVSTRAFGIPLETCSAGDWPDIAERVADALEAMHFCSPPPVNLVSGAAAASSWRDQLLAIVRDDLDPRGAGWPAKLSTSDNGSHAFEAGLARLQSLKVGAVPLTLVHGDLINKNVHIGDGRITGIFDWGCQRWGDHLYDLAWFDFWSPWHENLDVDRLRAALERRWDAAGYKPERQADRHAACSIYIGLEHLIYNATIDRWDDLDDVVDRMAELDLL